MSKRTYILSILLVALAIVTVLFWQHRNRIPTSDQPSAAATTATTTAARAPEAPAPQPPVATSANAVSAQKNPSTAQPETQPLPTDVIVPVLINETVLQAMQAYASSTSNFSFTGEDYPSLGFFVESIDGRQSNNGFYWILYINGTSSALGASSAKVAPGDSVEWRYKKGD